MSWADVGLQEQDAEHCIKFESCPLTNHHIPWALRACHCISPIYLEASWVQVNVKCQLFTAHHKSCYFVVGNHSIFFNKFHFSVTSPLWEDFQLVIQDLPLCKVEHKLQIISPKTKGRKMQQPKYSPALKWFLSGSVPSRMKPICLKDSFMIPHYNNLDFIGFNNFSSLGK